MSQPEEDLNQFSIWSIWFSFFWFTWNISTFNLIITTFLNLHLLCYLSLNRDLIRWRFPVRIMKSWVKSIYWPRHLKGFRLAHRLKRTTSRVHRFLALNRHSQIDFFGTTWTFEHSNVICHLYWDLNMIKLFNAF